MNKIYEFLGGRKMTLAIFLFTIATILLWVGKSDFSGWSNLIIWIFGTYAVGNVGEHLSPHLRDDCIPGGDKDDSKKK